MKKFLSLALACLMVFSLCACGASSAPAAESAPYKGMQNAASEEMGFDMCADTAASAEAPEPQPDSTGSEMPELNPEKIIYSSEVTLETTEFDESIEKLMALVEEYGGYVESSSMSDANYYSKINGYAGLRSASYTLRIPSSKFSEMSGGLSALGNVPYNHTYTENVSAQYYDTEARLKAYTAQEERLLEMLDAAETVEDILAIEGQLTNVRYEIESMQSSLKNWDRRINYSTIYLEMHEVSEYTDTPSSGLSYGERLLRSLKDGLYGVGRFFQNLLLRLVGALPALVLIAVLVIILRLVYKNIRAKRKDKKASKENK